MNAKPLSKMASKLAAALWLMAIGQGAAQTGVALWTNRYNGLANDNDQANAVAVDGSGNVFVTGKSYGAGSSDYATIKYSGAGMPLWTNLYIGPENSTDEANAIAVDGSGNVLVTGFSGGDYATIKYSSAGVPLWTNRYNGPGNGSDEARAVAVDANGNVFVTGGSGGIGLYYRYATVAYSGAGVPLWTNRYRGPGDGDDYALAVAVDSSGNVFVTGSSSSVGSTILFDYATIKYSSAGVPLWTNRYSGPGNSKDYASGLAVDSSGNVLVTGSSASSSDSDCPNYDYATIKYSGAGVPLWTNRYNGPGNYNDYAVAVALDGDGNVFVTGSSPGSGSFDDYATIKYSSAGVPLWTNRYNGPGNAYDYAFALAVDGNGNVFVTGSSFGSGSFSDYATIKYSEAGLPLWTNRYNGPGSDFDQANAVAVDSSGNVFVTGWSVGSGSSYDYATIKYSAIAPPNHAPVASITASPLFALSPGKTNLFILPPNRALAAVVFDGSQSSDADNDPLQFSWYADGQPNVLATGPVATILFGVGPHTVTLMVSDGQDTATAEISFEVITAAEAVEALIAEVNAAGERVTPLDASLYAGLNSLDKGQAGPAMNQLGAFQRKVRAQVQKSDPELAEKLIETVEVILQATTLVHPK